MFWAEIRKIIYTPVNPQFYYIKVGFKGVKIIWAGFRDACTPSAGNGPVQSAEVNECTRYK